MQIDFHHAVTYVLARIAGFSSEESEIISHASQYVDDATTDGVVEFTNGAMYSRISSAHKTIDLHNTSDFINHTVWVPFHFLPGNGGLVAGENPEGGFINKLVCTPDSFVAQEMLEKCIADSDKPYALHRLGFTIHVLADTFAHQGFAGVIHDINDINELDIIEAVKPRTSILDFINRIISFFIDKALPLGHGAAFTYPDLPFLKWRYTNKLDQIIDRDNLDIYKKAVGSIFKSLKKYKNNNADFVTSQQISKEDLNQIFSNLANFTNKDGLIRHRQWIDSIANGAFSFGRENISYIAKGIGSWKYHALNSENDHDTEAFVYSEKFLSSDWKRFHDALQKHRFEVIHDILSTYGICVS